MERRAIVNTICGILCTAGAGAIVAGIVNQHAPGWLPEIRAGSILLGLGGFGALLISGPQRQQEPTPDMPIREVFFYLDDDVLNAQAEQWKTVGRDLLDRLSTGRLQAWGRRIGRGNPHSRARAAQERNGLERRGPIGFLTKAWR
jgi:hypothetical protein